MDCSNGEIMRMLVATNARCKQLAKQASYHSSISSLSCPINGWKELVDWQNLDVTRRGRIAGTCV